jgi:outer membrane lipoprotein-sorting protein
MYENGKKVTNPNAKVLAKKINQLMTQLFSGEFMSEKEFTIQYFEHATAYKLELRPTSDRLKRYITRIDVTFDKSNLTMKEMTMVEGPTDRIVYRFDDIKINPTISDSQFTQFK